MKRRSFFGMLVGFIASPAMAKFAPAAAPVGSREVLNSIMLDHMDRAAAPRFSVYSVYSGYDMLIVEADPNG